MAKRGRNGLGLAAERLAPRKKLPPLLVPAGERPPERLHWLGASFGVTGQLLKLWKKAGFKLVYLRQTASELTGEHTGIMLRALDTEGMEEAPQDGWLEAFAADCRRRLVNLLGHEFQSFDCTTALSLVEAAPTAVTASNQGGNDSNSVSKRGGAGGVASGPLGATELSFYCGPHDLKRLELYSRNLVDYHLITDLLPTLSKLYFLGRMPSARMSHLQEAIMLAMGLQHRSVTLLSKELQLPDNQILALFNKAVRKLCNWLTQVSERAAENEMESRESKQKRLDTVKSAGEMLMLPASMDEDLEGGAKEAMAKMEGRKQELLESIDLAQYAVKGSEADWEAATKGISDKVGSVSIKSKASRSSEGQHESSEGRKKKKEREGKGGQGGDEDLGDKKSKKKNQKKRKHAD